jgi:hypothetical protein
MSEPAVLNMAVIPEFRDIGTGDYKFVMGQLVRKYA